MLIMDVGLYKWLDQEQDQASYQGTLQQSMQLCQEAMFVLSYHQTTKKQIRY